MTETQTAGGGTPGTPPVLPIQGGPSDLAAVVPSAPSDDEVRRCTVHAVALGWATTTLYRVCARLPESAAGAVYLPSDAELTPAEAARRYLERVQTGITRLKPHAPDAAMLLVAQLTGALGKDKQATGPKNKAQPCLRELHVQLLSGLAATDSRLGKSYALGAALSRIADQLGDQSTATPERRPPRRPARPVADGRRPTPARRSVTGAAVQREELLRVHDQVRDLATVLPDHVGQAVRESIGRWLTYLDAGNRLASAESRRQEVLLLQRQIFLWKALLTGEKDATDSLSAQEYLEVAVDSLRSIKRQVKRAVHAAVGWFPLLILLAGGAVVGVALAKSYTATASTTVVSTLLAAVASAWRSSKVNVGDMVSDYATKIRGSATDSAIAHAITVLPSGRRRRRVARRASRRALVPTTSGSVASRTSPLSA